MDAVLGIDLGTTAVKAGLIGLDGEVLGLSRRSYPMLDGPPGAAEQDPGAWWAAIVECIRALGPARARVGAICTTGQGPTLVAADAAGNATRPAITWLDRRSSQDHAARSGDREDSSRDFGLGRTMAWLAATDPAAIEQARWLMASWDWLGLRLSGVARTSLQWGEEAGPVGGAASGGGAAAGGGDSRATGRIPPAVPVGAPLGPLQPDLADELGLPRGVLVCAGVNDGTATILGAGLRSAGEAVDTGGASGGFAVYADRPLDRPGIFCAPAPLPGLWVIGGAMAATGAALEWLAGSVLGGRWTIDELIAEAAIVPAGADGLLFLPYLAGERSPIWDEHARGVFCGLTLGHGRAHLVRAVLEAAAFAIRDVAAPIEAAGIAVSEMRLAGRQAGSRTWAQIKADATGLPVAVPANLETSVAGAAILAAVAGGAHPDLATALAHMVRASEQRLPETAAAARYDRLFEVYRSLYPLLAPSFRELGAIAGT